VPTQFLVALRYPIASALAHAVVWYLLTLGGVYLVALVADLAAPSFGGQRDTEQAFKVVAFASTATWVAGVVYLVPSLAILALLGSVYSVYLLYLGVPEVMAVPRDRALGYTAVVAVTGLVAFFLVRGIAQAFLTRPG
jgi:hypothetical protein